MKRYVIEVDERVSCSSIEAIQNSLKYQTEKGLLRTFKVFEITKIFEVTS